jgi:hypothetical protein
VSITLSHKGNENKENIEIPSISSLPEQLTSKKKKKKKKTLG